MRIVMFLRPTNRYGTKGEYTAFRKLLLAKGFVLMQPEVFMAVAPTRRAAEQLLTHLQAQSPTTGTVCALVLTERQYASMRYLVGCPPYQEQSVGSLASVNL